VLDDDGRLAGMVNVAAVSNLAEERWASTPIARVMHRPPLPTLSPDQTINDVLAVLSSAPFAQLPVVREGSVVGMFGSNDIARFHWLRGRLRFKVSDATAERRRVGLGRPEA